MVTQTGFLCAIPILFVCLGFGLDNWWLAGAAATLYFTFAKVV